MIITFVAALAAAQAIGSAAPAPAAASNAAAVPAQAVPVVKPKKKRRTCSTGEAGLGSHIVMDTCPSDADEFEQLRAAHQAQQALQIRGPKVGQADATGPH